MRFSGRLCAFSDCFRVLGSLQAIRASKSSNLSNFGPNAHHFWRKWTPAVQLGGSWPVWTGDGWKVEFFREFSLNLFKPIIFHIFAGPSLFSFSVISSKFPLFPKFAHFWLIFQFFNLFFEAIQVNFPFSGYLQQIFHEFLPIWPVFSPTFSINFGYRQNP